MKKYALIIGIEDYPDDSGQAKVTYARNDAAEMAKYVKYAGFKLIGDGPILNEKATYSNIVEWIETMFNQVNRDDFVFLYYAGHGYYSEYGGFLIPYDFLSGKDINESTCLSYDLIDKRLNKKNPAKFIFLLDTCNSGSAVYQTDLRSAHPKENKRISYSARRMIVDQMENMVRGMTPDRFTGRVLFTSCSLSEVSMGIEKYEHGLFTYNLLYGLSSKTDQPEISIEELIQFTKDKMEQYSKNSEIKQTPVSYTNIQGKFLIPTYNTTWTDYMEDASKNFLDKDIQKIKMEKNEHKMGVNKMKSNNDGNDMDVILGKVRKKLIVAKAILNSDTDLLEHERSRDEKFPKVKAEEVGEAEVGILIKR